MKVISGKEIGDVERGQISSKEMNLREDGEIGWWEDEVLRMNYELGSEYRSVRSWKEKIN